MDFRVPSRSVPLCIKNVLWSFIKENKASVAGYLLLSTVVPISNVYLPHLYGKLISQINETKTIDQSVKLRFAAILVLWIIVQLMWAAMNALDAKFVPKLRSHVRKYIVDHVIDTYRENYSEDELGGIMAEIVRLPDEIDHMFYAIRNHILPMSILLVSSIGYFTATNPMLGLVSFVTIGAYIGVAIQFSKICIPIWDKMNDSHKTLYGEINDTLGNLLNVYTANQDIEEINRLDGFEHKFQQTHTNTIHCAGKFRLRLNMSYLFLFFSINMFSFYLFSRGKIQMNSLITVLIMSLELISKMSSFVGAIDKIMYQISTIKHVQKSLDALTDTPTVRGVGVPSSLGSTVQGDIVFKNVSDPNILKNVDLRIPAKSITALVGEIGSGKTTLLNVLLRLKPYSGNIYIDGVDTANVDLHSLRSQFLYIPQNPRLFNRSIYENISYGNNVDRNTVQQTLAKYKLPFNLDTPVGKFGQSLSGGQRQIVYLLRCLFKNAPIVLLDEPTSNLDLQMRDYMLSILFDILRGRTVVMITHDSSILEYADRVVKMRDGHIV